MVEIDVDIEEARWEKEQLEEIESCLDLIENLQKLFLVKDGTFLQAGDLTKAKGRRCILGISGLKYHKYEKFFEVTPAGVHMVAPYEEFNTYIAAPVDSIVRVLKGVLSGETSAFTSEWARGQAKIVGSKHLHDGYVFGQIFQRLARLIKRYRER